MEAKYDSDYEEYLIDSEGESHNENENVSTPFRILTNLWAHKNVIKELENIRLNPNLMSEKNIRNDLEFYIPQLCTFLIFGDYEAVEEFLAFLCKACYASFFFAHRVVWFLKSLLNNSNMNEKIEYIIQLIQAIFRSEKDKLKLERLHIANSRKYVDFLSKYNLLFIFHKNKEEIDESSLSPVQSYYYNLYKTTNNLIQSFSEKNYEYSISKEEEFKWDFFLKSDELFVNLFKSSSNEGNMINMTSSSKDSKVNTSEVETDNEVEKTKGLDINLLSFQSSVNFINQLCQICEKMKDIPNDDQLSFLKKELMQLNLTLPSNVYTPFLKDSIRNYLICHIPVTETRIFRTKNRAPYMITVEAIRIDEVINSILKNEKKKTSIPPFNRDLIPNDGLRQEHSVNNNQQSYIPPDFVKGRSFSMATSNKDLQLDNETLLVNKHDLTMDVRNFKKNTMSFAEPNLKQIKDSQMKRKKSSTIRMLEESDIRLSKPVIISNLEAENKRTPLRGEKKIILEENEEDYEESFLKEGVDEIVKRRLTVYPMANRKSRLDGDKNEINTSKITESELDKDEELIKYKSKGRNFTVSEPNRMKSQSILIEEESEVNIAIGNNLRNSREGSKNRHDSIECGHSINVDFQNVFGELSDQQANRIKSTSPFGQFSTWQLFKMIIKSGEDLRQEQFATQLINEFHQIFQLEKVGCWVNTYEIIATGNNVGIIECVPDAISIDQLKKKIKNNSLRTFFENYFGPTDSKKFKQSMNNFISSLAGYSLVCYFLQIKDRHNANILLDSEGHLIHIDFGFLLSNAPGKGLKFENAPFKLTAEAVETMGGSDSKYFKEFRKLLLKGFLAIVKHAEKILILVEMMYCGHGKNLPCFEHKEYTIEALKSRFYPKPKMTKPDYMRHVDDLISQSIDNWRTRWYDRFQYYVQGIFY